MCVWTTSLGRASCCYMEHCMSTGSCSCGSRCKTSPPDNGGFFFFCKAWAIYGLNAMLLWKILLVYGQPWSNPILHILAQATAGSTQCYLFLDSYLRPLQNYWVWLFIYRLLKTHLFKRQPVLMVTVLWLSVLPLAKWLSLIMVKKAIVLWKPAFCRPSGSKQ